MSTTLITGASGFIGKALAKSLDSSGRHKVVCLSRKKPDAPGTWIKGSFDSFEDLRHLDAHKIDAVVHLAAVTGGCSEEDGININVQGTRRLMRYLIDRGTRRFILASSIAAVGCLTGNEPRFMPMHLPMRPDHPCVGRDAYGLSKLLMEEIAKQFSRSVPDADVLSLRFGGVADETTFDGWMAALNEFPAWAFVLLGRVALGDVIACLSQSLEAPAKHGYRQFNLVGPDNCMDGPTAPAMRTIFGDRIAKLDLSHYERPGHEHDALWSMDETRVGLGFVPKISMKPSLYKSKKI